MKWLRRRLNRDESGAALVLAIIFMVVVGAIGGAMISSLATSQLTRSTLDQARNREYAADGAIEVAIGQMRSRMVAGTTPYCPTVSQTLNQVPITVTCVYTPAVTLSGLLQRNATFSAYCTGSANSYCPHPGSTHIIIRAQVNFESPSPLTQTAITVNSTFIQSWTVVET